ncbi:hypothetical protein GCM10011297_20540 [Bacterioplanes sanyensis]|uniref:DUF4336 domain-containing protein n=1 Tax=Bacterioplanes sanyensis TaxID=1249553 RepID=UPI001676EA40|nr:DUF4336 domain-containing protein [Bacterioplanes sanyensis]GGY47611.1 hypothetical protein GCM10011297_20540 [Bacterioplanes sanyensis]
MLELADDIWVVAGETVPFFTLPFSTRMVVVRLADGGLWIHSPVRLRPAMQQQLDALGEVRYLIAPNALHHLFLADWQEAYPQAHSYGTQGVAKKRPDLHFDGILDDANQWPWQPSLHTAFITGSAVMQEAVFFHRPSHTLIVTDLIENFAKDALPIGKRWLAQLAGVVAPNGKTPLDWRLTFYGHKSEIRSHIEQLLSWQPQRIVMAHGVIVHEQAEAFLRRSFAWTGIRTGIQTTTSELADRTEPVE